MIYFNNIKKKKEEKFVLFYSKIISSFTHTIEDLNEWLINKY